MFDPRPGSPSPAPIPSPSFRVPALAALVAAAVVASGGVTTIHTQGSPTAPALRYGMTLGSPLTGTRGQPLVVDLDGDQQPEIVFITMSGFSSRRLVAIRGATGAVAFNADAFLPNAVPPIVIGDSFSELAAGDLDGDGRPEIVAVDAHDGTAPDPLRRSLLAFRPTGALLWSGDDVVSDPLIDTTSGFTRPVIHDLDGDGLPEIVVGYSARGPLTPNNVSGEDYVTAFDHLGHIRWTARGAGTNVAGHSPVVADIDLDGSPEVLYSDDVFSAQGVRLRSVADVNLRVADVAVANLDDDAFAEILYMDTFGRLHVYEHSGVRKWGPITPPGPQAGLSQPAIGDLTGDGLPEIVVVRHQSIEVIGRDGASLRSVPLPQPGLGGNVTIFDLDADGLAELIYHSGQGPFDTAAERGALYVVDGQSGALQPIAATRSGSDDQRGPIVADVDGDGPAEIVVGGWTNNILVRVFTAATGTWAQTRPVWNQHAYHATHVTSSGRIPAYAPINWLTPGLNSFRVNGGPDAAPGPAPTSGNDAYNTTPGNALTVPAPGVLGNDTAGGHPMSALLVSGPAHGTVSLSASGSFQYTPAAGFSGVDTWSYRAAATAGPGNVATVSMAVAAAGGPVPPTGLRLAAIAGNTVTLEWNGPTAGPTPTGFQLEGGLAPGQVIGAVPLGTAPAVTLALPTGVFYLRVRTIAGGAVSSASNEIQVYVNVPAPPGAPTNLLGLVVGNALTLAWKNAPTGGAPTSIVLEVSGAIAAALPLGVTESFAFAGVPGGTYTFMVRATNGSGVSAASNAVTLTFPTACSGVPLTPAGFAASATGNVVSLSWNPPTSGPAPTSYVLNVTGAFVGSLPLTVRSLTAAVPPGSYTLSVTALNPCGPGAPTATRTVVVP